MTGRRRVRELDDSGFTLVEALVSLMVLGIIFTALAAAAMGSLRASMNSRAEQQAIDFATEALEQARQADYYALAHDVTDVSADSRAVAPCGSTWCFNPGDGAEELVMMTGGVVNPHIATINSEVNNGTDFTVATYVTRPVATGADVKRVTAVTRWTVAGHQRERVASSIVTATSRGLPIPLFAFETASNTQAVNPGTGVAPYPVVAFKIEMTNQGAPDRWDLTTDTGTWTFWLDNGDNILCTDATSCGDGVSVDTQMVDSDDAGTAVDTGRLDPTRSLVFWAVRQVPETTVGAYWTSLTATATSVDHEGVDAGLGVKTLRLRTIVTTDAVTGVPGGGSPTTTLPTAPRNLALTVGDGQLVATWLAPDDPGSSAVSDYRVEYKAAAATNWSTESDVDPSLSRAITGLTNGAAYDVRVAAVNTAGIGAYSAAIPGTPTAGVVFQPASICVATNPSPSPSATAASGFTLWKYALHNRSSTNGAWPGTGAPPPSRTDVQGVPLNMIKDLPEFPAGTTLPVYSADVSTLERGRVILEGGDFTTGTSDTEKFVDWRTDSPGKQYSGSAVLTIWVAPATGNAESTYSLTAQLYKSAPTDASMGTDNSENLRTDLPSAPYKKHSQPGSIAGTWCGGPADWQQVSIPLPIVMTKALAANESLGVRLWNTGSDPVRIAYDMAGEFPAYLTLPEM